MSYLVAIIILVVVLRVILRDLRPVFPILAVIAAVYVLARILPGIVGALLGPMVVFSIMALGLWIMVRGLFGGGR